jgi:phage portal protein BeeE
MQTTSIYACGPNLVRTIASLPLHIYEYKDGGVKERVKHPLTTSYT